MRSTLSPVILSISYITNILPLLKTSLVCEPHSKWKGIWSDIKVFAIVPQSVFTTESIIKAEIFSHNSFASGPLAIDILFKVLTDKDVMFSLVFTDILKGCPLNFFPSFILKIIDGHLPLIFFLLVVSKWNVVANSSSDVSRIANTVFHSCLIAKRSFVPAMTLADCKTLLHLHLIVGCFLWFCITILWT